MSNKIVWLINKIHTRQKTKKVYSFQATIKKLTFDDGLNALGARPQLGDRVRVVVGLGPRQHQDNLGPGMLENNQALAVGQTSHASAVYAEYAVASLYAAFLVGDWVAQHTVHAYLLRLAVDTPG